MNNNSNIRESQPSRLLRHMTFYLSSVVILFCIIVLTEWLIGTLHLANIKPGYVPMAPATAISFLLLGAVIFLRRWKKIPRILSVYLQMATIFVLITAAIIGLREIISSVTGFTLDIEDFLVVASLSEQGFLTGRMSPLTAILFVLTSLSMLVYSLPLFPSTRLRLLLSNVLYMSVLVIALIVIIGYWYNEPFLYGGTVVPVALITAIGFLLTACALLFESPGSFLYHFVSGKSVYLEICRLVIPLTIIQVLVGGWVYKAFLYGRFFSSDDLLASMTALAIAAIIALAIPLISRRVQKIVDHRMQEQKNTEAVLRKSQEWLARATRVAKLGSWEWDIVTGELVWSEEVYKLYDMDPKKDKPTYQTVIDTVPDEYRASFIKAVENAINNGVPFDSEYAVMRPDGTKRYTHTSGEVSYDAQGKPVSLFGIVQDITRRKLAENSLRESEQKYTSIVEKSNEGIVIVSNGIVEFCNQQILNIIDYSMEEVKGQPFIDFIADPHRELVIDRYQRRISGEPVISQYELEIVGKHGKWIPIEISASLIQYEGKPADMVIIRDITERKRAEEDLKRSQQLLEQTFAALNEAIFVVETKGSTIVACNKAAENIFGYHQSEMIGRTFEFLNVDRKWFGDFRNALFTSLDKTGFFQTKCRMRRKDGSIFPSENIDTQILNESGQRVFVVTTIRDISEHKQAEDEVKERNKQLAALQQVSQALTQSVELRDVAKLALESTIKVLNMDGGTIRYLDESSQELVLIADYGLPRELVQEITTEPRVGVGRGLAGKVAQKVEPLIIEDLANFTDYFYSSFRKSDFRYYAGIPLLVKGRLVGVISCFSLQPRVFAKNDMELLVSLGNMVGMAIANSWLFEAQKLRTEELAAIGKVSQVVSQSLDMRIVAQLALETALGILKFDGGSIRYMDRIKQELPPLSHYGLPPELLQLVKSKPPPKSNEGLAGKAVSTGEIILSDDLNNTEGRYYGKEKTSEFHTSVFIPLKAKGEVVGVMGCLSRNPRKFQSAEIELMGSIANMAGMAIFNARLFEQVETAALEWRNTFDSMGEGVSIHSPDYRILRANRTLAEMLGTTPAALVGQHCYKAIHNLSGPIENCPLSRCLSSSQAAELTTQEVNLGNRWLNIRCDPVRNAQGQLVSFIHIVMDITEEKQRQENMEILYRLSQKLSTSLNLDSVSNIALDELARVIGDDASTTCITLVDESSQEQVFISARGLYEKQLTNIRIPATEIRQEIRDLFKEQRNALFLNDLSKAPETLKRLPFWTEFRSATFFPFMVRNRLIGVLIAYSKSITPLSVNKVDFLASCASEIAMALENARLFGQTDEALKHRIAEVEAIISSMEDGLIVVDSQKKVTYFNPTAEMFLGVTAIKSLGRPFGSFDKSTTTDIANLEQWLMTASEAQHDKASEQKLSFEIWNPERRVVEVSLFNIDKDGEHFGSGLLLRDITREHEIDRMKTEFVSLASHELRTPLTVIYGFAELLLISKKIPEEQHGWTERIYKETQRLSKIVDDFLDISRIEGGRLSIKLDVVSFKPLVTHLISQLGTGYQTHSFINEVPDNFPRLYVDTERLTQVLYNLMDNAAKYSPQRGYVKVTASKDESGAQAIIAVADNGIGISKEDIPMLFNRFYRIQHPETASIRGTGLGLSIVKALVEMMGGRVWVESQLNSGSTFYIALPLADTTQS